MGIQTQITTSDTSKYEDYEATGKLAYDEIRECVKCD